MKQRMSVVVIGRSADKIACFDLLALGDNHGRQITIHGDVGSVTNQHVLGAAKSKDCCHNAIEHTACTGTGLTGIIHALVIQRHMTQTFHSVLSKMSSNAIRTGQRHRQTPAISFEITRELTLFRSEPTAAL